MIGTSQPYLAEVLKKERLKIVMTDSGLGGLSVCADVDARLRRHPIYKDLSITYFNAWPAQNRGYNKFSPLNERIRIFNKALWSMVEYEPDLIVIACNTLSALYQHTEFRHKSNIPILGIIDFGVDLFYKKFVQAPRSKLVVLGTMTMIAENTHKNLLIGKGIEEERIITQACDGLATALEMDSKGSGVHQLADKYLSEAIQKLGQTTNRLFIALCCTHFSFGASIIRQKAGRYFKGMVEILDPNALMGAYLISQKIEKVYDEPSLKIEMVSKVPINNKQVKSITNFVGRSSPQTARALADYKYKPDLFSF